MADVTVAMKLKPWVTPNFALVDMPPRPKQEGVSELPSIPVGDLTPEALTGLAEQWLTDLYTKACKTPNWSFATPIKDTDNG